MKKPIFSFLIIIIVLLGINFVLAKDSPNGQPFDFLWESVNSLVEQVSSQQGQIDEQQEQISNQQTQIDNILGRIEELEARECVPGFTESCDTGLLGVCSVGTRICSPEQTWGVCIQNEQPSPEVIDDLDNDCNGIVDDIPLYPVLEDDFNSYHDGDLGGQGSWTGTDLCVIQGDVVYEGTKAVKCSITSNDDVSIQAEGLSIPDGAQTIFFRFDNGSHRFRFNLLSSSYGGVINVIFHNQTAKYRDKDGIFHEIVSGLAVNTWHQLQVQWRSIDKYARYKIDDNEWTNWDDTEGILVPTRLDLNMDGNFVGNDFTVYYDNLY